MSNQTAAPSDGLSSRAPVRSLSVVMPVFNEQHWIERSVAAVVLSAEMAGWPIEVVVVDDGSTDGTPQRLARLAELYQIPGQCQIKIITQENRGRFAARQAGLRAARGDQVLLLDSRVIIDRRALAFLRDQLMSQPQRCVWNGHVNVMADRNVYGGFWAGIVAVPWRRYLAQPRMVSFGIEEFDLFPKGTGFFCAPRQVLLAAANSFSSLFADMRMASDDTRMLRWIAQRQRISLSPDFSATYHSRDSLAKFVRHSFFRGTTFVDGYLDSPGPARRAAVAAAAATAAGLLLLVRRPRTGLLLGVAGPLAVGGAVRRCGASQAEARAVVLLLPVFGVFFGAGVVRGLALAARKAIAKFRAR